MEQKIKCVNENEVRYFVGTQKTRWNDSKKNMWKRKIQIKNVQNGLLGTLLNLLRLKIEKKKEKWNWIQIIVSFKSDYLTRISAPTIYRISSFNKKKKVQITEYSGDYTNKAYQWLYLEWWFIICILEKCCQLLMLHVKEKNEWKKNKVKTNPSKRRIFSKQVFVSFSCVSNFDETLL